MVEYISFQDSSNTNTDVILLWCNFKHYLTTFTSYCFQWMVENGSVIYSQCDSHLFTVFGACLQFYVFPTLPFSEKFSPGLCHHHQLHTNWRKIIKKNGVPCSSIVPETCQMPKSTKAVLVVCLGLTIIFMFYVVVVVVFSPLSPIRRLTIHLKSSCWLLVYPVNVSGHLWKGNCLCDGQ